MSKTEGPWIVSEPTVQGGVFVRHFGASKYYGSLETGLAAADELNKLEAVREAAPDLLAACKRSLPWLSADYPEHPVTSQLRAAIAKAEGGAQ